MSISSHTASADGKIIANGTHKYKLSYTLKDIFGNKVVPVRAEENNNVQIKAVDSTLEFHNGLHVNQLTNSGGTGDKLVGVANLLPTKITTFANDINNTGIISMSEAATSNPNGIYEISLASAVPTHAAYPYINEDARLFLKSFTNTTDRIQANADMIYPTTGSRMGYGTTVANTAAS